MWNDTELPLPENYRPGPLRDVFTHRIVPLAWRHGRAHLRAAELFTDFCVALLIDEDAA